MHAPRQDPRLLGTPLQGVGRSVDDVRAEFGLSRVVKLAANESPVGPSPRAVAAAIEMLAQAHRYPGALDAKLREKLAANLDPTLQAENVLVGNGGTDVLRMITQAFVFEGGNTIMCRASFPMYHVFTRTFGGETRKIEPRADMAHDLDAMAAAVDDDTRVVFLCSPNNPTGHILHTGEVERFLDRVPSHVVVVFDESYCDFVTEDDYADSLAMLREGRRLLTVRSFSKTAGLAGLRVGYLVGPADLVEYIAHVRLPFQVSDICLAAAMASLEDHEHLAAIRTSVIEGREQLRAGLAAMGLTVLPSQANFVTMIDLPAPPEAVQEELLRRGFMTQTMGPFGFPGGLRVSVGSAEENAAYLEVQREVLAAVVPH